MGRNLIEREVGTFEWRLLQLIDDWGVGQERSALILGDGIGKTTLTNLLRAGYWEKLGKQNPRKQRTYAARFKANLPTAFSRYILEGGSEAPPPWPEDFDPLEIVQGGGDRKDFAKHFAEATRNDHILVPAVGGKVSIVGTIKQIMEELDRPYPEAAALAVGELRGIGRDDLAQILRETLDTTYTTQANNALLPEKKTANGNG